MTVHGGNWYEYRRTTGKRPVDFSVNLSPLGVPPAVQAAMVDALEDAEAYPDPSARELREAIGAKLGVDPAWVVCGNGAADLIYRAVDVIKPKHALVVAPCFTEYERALNQAGASVTRYVADARAGFAVQPDILDAIDAHTDMIFLAQPSNPTGRSVPKELVRALLARCKENDCLLVLDECFCDFMDNPESASIVKEIAADAVSGPVLILKSFTKAFAIPGVRLGYALSPDPALVAAIADRGQPWPVNNIALAAGTAALKEDAYLADMRRVVSRERKWLRTQLELLNLEVVPSEANFFLFRSEVALTDALLERGFLVRHCADFAGLDNQWYRVCIRQHEENAALVEALKEVLASHE